MTRIKSGVYGFDNLVNGGFRTNSVNIILADPGCGKSTFCWQYCSYELNKPALLISLEQDTSSILKDAKSIGIHNIEKKFESGTLQIKVAFQEESDLTSGRRALNFLLKELDLYLDELQESASKLRGGVRIAIDPLNPLLMETNSLNEQRNTLQRIFTRLRKIGTTVIALEKGFGESMVKIPSYLADSIIELEYIGLGGILNRTLIIRKFRGSSHSERPIPIGFENGKGLVIYDLE
ncbi:MAG: RAD55 family ATPase [Candidatus Hodarchaeales archaeon]